MKTQEIKNRGGSEPPVQLPQGTIDSRKSHIHGTRADRMPNPEESKGGETEDRARDAFLGRPLILPESQGDLADRAFQDQEAELEEQVARIRRRGGG